MSEEQGAGSAELEDKLTEEWLRSVGFKWHQLERQPAKMWTLWLGDCTRTGLSSFEDLGIEVSDNGKYPQPGAWSVWLRGDYAGRYSRFIHIRYVYTRREVIRLIEALTGQAWEPANILYGSMRTPEQARRILEEERRLDLKWMRESSNHAKWSNIEKDDTLGRPLPEHLEFHEKNKPKT